MIRMPYTTQASFVRVWYELLGFDHTAKRAREIARAYRIIGPDDVIEPPVSRPNRSFARVQNSLLIAQPAFLVKDQVASQASRDKVALVGMLVVLRLERDGPHGTLEVLDEGIGAARELEDGDLAVHGGRGAELVADVELDVVDEGSVGPEAIEDLGVVVEDVHHPVLGAYGLFQSVSAGSEDPTADGRRTTSFGDAAMAQAASLPKTLSTSPSCLRYLNSGSSSSSSSSSSLELRSTDGSRWSSAGVIEGFDSGSVSSILRPSCAVRPRSFPGGAMNLKHPPTGVKCGVHHSAGRAWARRLSPRTTHSIAVLQISSNAVLNKLVAPRWHPLLCLIPLEWLQPVLERLKTPSQCFTAS